MKHMKKWAVMLAMVLVFAMAAGCGGDDKKDTAGSSSASSGKGTTEAGTEVHTSAMDESSEDSTEKMPGEVTTTDERNDSSTNLGDDISKGLEDAGNAIESGVNDLESRMDPTK